MNHVFVTLALAFGASAGVMELLFKPSPLEIASHTTDYTAHPSGLERGDHLEFSYYGSQLGDNAATISREVQQKLTVDVILFVLKSIQENK